MYSSIDIEIEALVALRLRQRLRALGLEEQAEHVAKRHGIWLELALAPGRHQEAVRARRALWLRLHERGMSFAGIARLFEMDHVAILNGVRTARRRQKLTGGAS